jgi:hypothetical protein
MTVLAASQAVEVLEALGVGLLASVVSAGGLAWLRQRQRRRVRTLAHAVVEPSAMASAVEEAVKKRGDVIRDVIGSAVAEVADDQGLRDSLVRGAIYSATDDESLAIVKELTVNFDWADTELGRAQPGEDAVGRAFAEASVVVDTHGGFQTTKPEVSWSISVPVMGGSRQPVWVLSIEGLIEDRTIEQLEPSVAHLLYYRELLELLLKSLAERHEHRSEDHRRITAES